MCPISIWIYPYLVTIPNLISSWLDIVKIFGSHTSSVWEPDSFNTRLIFLSMIALTSRCILQIEWNMYHDKQESDCFALWLLRLPTFTLPVRERFALSESRFGSRAIALFRNQRAYCSLDLGFTSRWIFFGDTSLRLLSNELSCAANRLVGCGYNA